MQKCGIPVSIGIVLFVLFPGLLLASCGGGGGGGPAGPPVVTILSDAALDGQVSSAGAAFTGATASVGDFDVHHPGVGFRGFFSFDITSIPSGATIQSALFRVFQAGINSADPFPSHGPVIASHVLYGATLDGSDYAGTTASYNIGTVSNSAAVGWRELDVTAAVQATLGAQPRAQFRVEFAIVDSNDDGQTQSIWFETSTDLGNTGNKPRLIVTYTVP